jgi:hypothetical protein
MAIRKGAAWNGHFDCTCYHPNFLFNQFGMLERCALRHGNVHSADGWRDVLDPVIARYAVATVLLISSRWRCIASVSALGIMIAAPVPRSGQIAPKR